MFRLLLPILFPSWRFFDRAGSIVQIEPMKEKPLFTWTALFLNPRHNEYLFLHTLAERIVFEQNLACVSVLKERLGDNFRILVDGEVKYES